MSSARSLRQTEEAINDRLNGLELDFGPMRALSNLHRAASAVRNHFEQSVLKDAELTWTAFVVLWVIWIFRSMESRHVAQEAGINKATLTGVVKTLELRGLLTRQVPENDRRRRLLGLTERGEALMSNLFPAFNQEERFVVDGIDESRVTELGGTLRLILRHIEQDGAARQAAVRRGVDATSAQCGPVAAAR